ncbi:hypothetical protein [Saccharopolyspora gloriosae]|uniref:Uncharacterized protein n=1 Tax=Saccharopolyspora gloriosae TaxID=455344 RepID=A0A840NK40_9PSEU|nr:hypothetical protein [Saccharopolyspora gloriosae]MBB5072250.1 hypothetical protein [Saccharopolyspora gloriosae]
MVIERNRWVRRTVVGQPLIAWPCSMLLWAGGGPAALSLAAVVLWISTASCVFGIVAPMYRDDAGHC